VRMGRYGEFTSCSDYPTCKPERKARPRSTPPAGRRRVKTPTVPAA